MHGELVRKLCVLAEDRAAHYQVETVLEDVLQHAATVQMLHVLPVFDHARPREATERRLRVETEAKIKVLIEASAHTVRISSQSVGRMLYLGKVLNVLDALLEVLHSLDENAQLGIERDLAVHVGLTMHEAAVGILQGAMIQIALFDFLFLQRNRFGLLLRQELFLLAVLQTQLQLTNDTVFALAIGGTVEEQRASQHGLLVFLLVRARLSLMLMDRVEEVFDG